MPGPQPKPRATRARRNKPATAATLQADPKLKAPKLPAGRTWQPETLAWWADVWASPMAPEYMDSDRHGLFLLAVLVDDFWLEPSTDLAKEIRLQRQCFGLSPIDRRRLEWEIGRGEDAKARTRTPPAAPATSGSRRKAADPRGVLRAV